jgi:hypothetical protein
MDQGKGTLGGEEKKPVISTSEEGKKRFEKAKGIKAKQVLSTTGGLGDDAKSLVPYTKFFSAGFVGEEMDPVGGVLGNRASRSYGGLISHDAMTVTDFLYIDIGQEDDVQVGDRFIVYSQYEDVRHPLQTFSITFEREIDLLDDEYLGQYYHNLFSARRDIVGSQILVKGVIKVVETASITSKAAVERAFNPIQVDDSHELCSPEKGYPRIYYQQPWEQLDVHHERCGFPRSGGRRWSGRGGSLRDLCVSPDH